MGIIENVNGLSQEEFDSKYMAVLPDISFEHNGIQYTALRYSSSTIPRQDLNDCFSLIELTSKDAYSSSSTGWAPGKKRREMKLPDLKYVILTPLRGGQTTDDGVEAFVSFMPTYEDGHEVIYCYELHVSPRLQGLRIGTRMMQMLEEVGRGIGVEKVMLTVFMANEKGVKFYEKTGYALTLPLSSSNFAYKCTRTSYTVDEFSPSPRVLRNGTIKMPSYVILSKGLKH